MLRPDVQWGFQALVDLDLTIDALGFSRHLANFHTILMRYPDMRVVIEHCMKPQIRGRPRLGHRRPAPLCNPCAECLWSGPGDVGVGLAGLPVKRQLRRLEASRRNPDRPP